MPKNAVYFPINREDYDPALKQLCLLFDRIYINETDLFGTPYSKQNNSPALFDYLQQRGVVVAYRSKAAGDERKFEHKEPVFVDKFPYSITEEDLRRFASEYEVQKAPGWLNQVDDIFSRIDAVDLAQQYGNAEFYPVLRSAKTFGEGTKKAELLHFILDKIPVPADSVSWEQLCDFREDPGTLNRYLAMINWVNELAASKITVRDFVDRFEHLYHDYMLHFQAHKLAYHYTQIELLVAGIAAVVEDVAKMRFASFLTGTAKVFTLKASLMEKEAKLPGKELAYIHKATTTFGR